jgi:hypothetical protein
MKRRVARGRLRRRSRVGEPASGNVNYRAHASLANIRCEPALDLFAEFKIHFVVKVAPVAFMIACRPGLIEFGWQFSREASDRRFQQSFNLILL